MTLAVFISAVAFVGVLVWVSQPTVAPSGLISADSLVSTESLYDFGIISMAQGKISHSFSVKNNSQQPVTITKIYTSCMCTAARFKLNGKTYGLFGMPGHGVSALTAANLTLKPGESGMLEAIYDPNAHGPAGIGPVDRFIYLEDAQNGQFKLEIKAVVTP